MTQDQHKRRQEILELVRGLRKYCHAKNCNFYNSCPREPEHFYKCRRNLGLDTAIAWNAAILTENLLDNPDTSSFLAITALRWTLERHLENYTHLYDLLVGIESKLVDYLALKS